MEDARGSAQIREARTELAERGQVRGALAAPELPQLLLIAGELGPERPELRDHRAQPGDASCRLVRHAHLLAGARPHVGTGRTRPWERVRSARRPQGRSSSG